MKLLIPSIDRQNEIVEYCEFNNSIIKQLEKEIEQNKKQAKLFIPSIIKTNVEQEDIMNEIIDVESLTNSIEEIESINEDEVQSISSIEQEPNIVIEEVKSRVVKKLVKE